MLHETGPNGVQVQVTRRDAAQAEAHRKRKAQPLRLAKGTQEPPTACPRAAGVSAVELPPPPKGVPPQGASSSSGARGDFLLQRRVQETGAALTPPIGRPSATERLEARRARLIGNAS